MDILEALFTVKPGIKEEPEENDAEEIADECESGSEEGEENMEEPALKLMKLDNSASLKQARRCRNRPERGKFTILDGTDVAEPEEVLQLDFTADIIQKIFKDSRVGIQFLARYGIIPNQRECKILSCPKEQLMSLIKHSNGYVWRCRSCRKRRERRVITKISVYEGTFLFYSRMPMNKFFIFMLIWCENPGYTATEYNRLLGEYRLVEETIHNTIGFIRDHIQSWCQLKASRGHIGGEGCHVEIIETFHTEDVSSKHRNRRERHFTTKLVLICWETEQISICDIPERKISKELLKATICNSVKENTVVVMRDSLMEKFGSQEEINAEFEGMYQVKTIADVWMEIDEGEKDRQFVKTLMESVNQTPGEPFAYEYYFRRCSLVKPFNHLLKAIRELYTASIRC